jgi:hypothetical protein
LVPPTKKQNRQETSVRELDLDRKGLHLEDHENSLA